LPVSFTANRDLGVEEIVMRTPTLLVATTALLMSVSSNAPA